MSSSLSRTSLVLLSVLVACSSDAPTTAPSVTSFDASAPSALLSRGDRDDDDPRVLIAASGLGVVDLTAANGGFADFWFLAVRLTNGATFGAFRQSRTRNGKLVDFEGRVTCVTTDPAFPGRARIGGVVTRNRSTDPDFLTVNHVVGAHVWFRVTDSRRGTDAADASTTYGFKPTLVDTSEQYCALPFTGLPQWNPASIFPLKSGFIRVTG